MFIRMFVAVIAASISFHFNILPSSEGIRSVCSYLPLRYDANCRKSKLPQRWKNGCSEITTGVNNAFLPPTVYYSIAEEGKTPVSIVAFTVS